MRFRRGAMNHSIKELLSLVADSEIVMLYSDSLSELIQNSLNSVLATPITFEEEIENAAGGQGLNITNIDKKLSKKQ